MAVTPTTLQTLITAIRQRSNMENNQFITDAELTTMINSSLAELDAILVSKFNDYHITFAILTPQQGPTGAGVSLTLPADFLKLRGVDVQVTASDPDGYIPLREFNFQQRVQKPYLMTGMAGYGPNTVTYRLGGSGILLEPAQVALQWNYRVWYVPDYVPLVNTTDTLQSYMDSQGWSEMAINDVCAKVLEKQDLDSAQFVARKEKYAQLVMTLAAPNRNQGEPAAVTDTRNWDMGHGGPYGWFW